MMEKTMLPYVIIHIGVSLDGRLDWGPAMENPYYELVSRINADADLSGSATILKANLPEDPLQAFPWMAEQGLDKSSRPLLAVVDSRGQIRTWHLIRKQPWWREFVALCSEATPASHLAYLEQQQVSTIIAGREQVDLRRALEELHARYGARVLRVDSGGILNGALLRAGLVDEVSVLISPWLVGGLSPQGMFTAPDLTSAEGVIPLTLVHMEKLSEQFVWLRYRVNKA